MISDVVLELLCDFFRFLDRLLDETLIDTVLVLHVRDCEADQGLVQRHTRFEVFLKLWSETHKIPTPIDNKNDLSFCMKSDGWHEPSLVCSYCKSDRAACCPCYHLTFVAKLVRVSSSTRSLIWRQQELCPDHLRRRNKFETLCFALLSKYNHT